jgi:hypothetical protein
MPAACVDTKSSDPLDTIPGPDLLPVNLLVALRDCTALRADLGQSQSGNSTLSPQACRVETRPPNWPYRRFDRLPLSVPLDTTHGAPWWARGVDVKGGRTDRWLQIPAIPSRIRNLLSVDDCHYIDSYVLHSGHARRPCRSLALAVLPRSGNPFGPSSPRDSAAGPNHPPRGTERG